MTNRERIWQKAIRWEKSWEKNKIQPTLKEAYVAGWQAAIRETQKHLKLVKTP